MSQQGPAKGKRKYHAPATVPLGEAARAAGDCRTGTSNVEGTCVNGELNQGQGAGDCLNGPSNVGIVCQVGGNASDGGGCSTGTTAP